MIRTRIRRLSSVLSVALLGVLLVGIAPVSAANPNWDISFVRLPPTVQPGSDAGYRITVSNTGPSNINALRVDLTTPDDEGATPTYFSGLAWSPAGAGSGTCNYAPPDSGSLGCSLGTLAAYTSVTFTVAYLVPDTGAGSTFDVVVALRAGTGDTGSDGPGKSRGDAYSETVRTALSNSSNFDGGFFQADEFLETNQDLGRRNRQSTTLNDYDASIANPYDVMIQDGSTSLPTDDPNDDQDNDDPNNGLACTGAKCSSLYGEWSYLTVNEGATETTPFHVTVRILASEFPGGTTEAQVLLVHTYFQRHADGSLVLDTAGNPISVTEIIGDDPGERCAAPDAAPAATPCIFVAKSGGIFTIDAWLFHNGAVRGGI